jgi:hypothetical protein
MAYARTRQDISTKLMFQNEKNRRARVMLDLKAPWPQQQMTGAITEEIGSRELPSPLLFRQFTARWGQFACSGIGQMRLFM